MNSKDAKGVVDLYYPELFKKYKKEELEGTLYQLINTSSNEYGNVESVKGPENIGSDSHGNTFYAQKYSISTKQVITTKEDFEPSKQITLMRDSNAVITESEDAMIIESKATYKNLLVHDQKGTYIIPDMLLGGLNTDSLGLANVLSAYRGFN